MAAALSVASTSCNSSSSHSPIIIAAKTTVNPTNRIIPNQRLLLLQRSPRAPSATVKLRGIGGRVGKAICVRASAAAEGVGTSGGSSSSMATEKLGIVVETNPTESRLSGLGVKQWPKWGCPPSKFPWTYSDKETCYLLKGKVKVTPAGATESVEIQAGDLVIFPEGMSCTWDVSETVDKHYKFG